MTTDSNSFLMGSKVPSFSWKNVAVGTSVSGTITEEPLLQQQRDFDDDTLLWWDKEETQPKNQLKVVLKTTEFDPINIPDDKGIRALYVKGNMQRAIASAVRTAGANGLSKGGTLTVTFTGEKEVVSKSGRKMNPAKEYTAVYVAPNVLDAVAPPPQAKPTLPAGMSQAVFDALPDNVKAQLVPQTDEPPF